MSSFIWGGEMGGGNRVRRDAETIVEKSWGSGGGHISNLGEKRPGRELKKGGRRPDRSEKPGGRCLTLVGGFTR